MRLAKGVVFIFLAGMLGSCFNPPEYPDSPEIVFKDVTFKKGGNLPDGSFVADTVFLAVFVLVAMLLLGPERIGV